MTDGFLPADYILCGLAIAMAVLGLFRGLSGTLGFFAAALAAALVGSFGWTYSATLASVTWQRVAGVLVATLLAFGLVRIVVRKLVNGLLAQPSDAILGLLLGVGLGVALIAAWAHSGMYLEYSHLAKALSSCGI